MIEKNVQTEQFGRFEFEDGSIYEGGYLEMNGTKYRHGQGTLTFSSNSSLETKFEKYSGQWKNDKMDGFGVYEYITGAIFTGFWKLNKHHGKGKYEFPDGSYYEGDWENHMMHGEGTFRSKEGQSWRGEFREGNFSSKMQNELKTQKRIELKKKIISLETTSFLNQLFDILDGDKKSIKETLKNMFAFSVEEEVKSFKRI